MTLVFLLILKLIFMLISISPVLTHLDGKNYLQNGVNPKHGKKLLFLKLIGFEKPITPLHITCITTAYLLDYQDSNVSF